MIQVFKFGGASIATAERIQNIVTILQQVRYEQLVIVVSAMGKTTNALEQVVHAYFNNKSQAFSLLQQIEEQHYNLCKELFEHPQPIIDSLNNHFVEGYWLLEEEPQDSFAYCYDQIVSIGELASSTILAYLLQNNNIATKWVDARGCIKTTDQYQEGEIIWNLTQQSINKEIAPYLNQQIVVTQGFIGSTDENHTTTLGREGSDFTGAILANCLNAIDYTIWKDVPGVLNADPRIEKDVTQFYQLSYREAVEMTYYGAKVIHPKTIKPVQNKNIPLIVRSFLTLEQQGTVITNAPTPIKKGVKIHLHQQTLIHFTTKDFSFFEEDQIVEVMNAIKQNNVTINLLQRGAIHCSFVIDENVTAVQTLQQTLQNYTITVENNLTLSTIRHYSANEIEALQKENNIFIEQKTPITYQIVYK